MLLPGEIRNIDELIQYLRQEIERHPESMSLKQQESIAAGVVGLMVNDEFDKWRQEHPTLDAIWNMAADLEMSNIASVKDAADSWRVIAKMVDELDARINSK